MTGRLFALRLTRLHGMAIDIERKPDGHRYLVFVMWRPGKIPASRRYYYPSVRIWG